MGNNVDYVSAGKPKIGGAVYRAPSGTTLPTNAVSDLDAAFAALGYVSEDGVSNANNRDINNIKAWGGDTVLVVQNSKDDSFAFKLVEAVNSEVLKAVHGSENVNGDLANGLAIEVNATEAEEAVWVIDMLLKGNICKRIVIPRGQVTEVEDVVYNDSEPIGYGVTLSCLPDTNGNTHYEYIQSTPTGSISLDNETASVAAGATTTLTATTTPAGGTVKWFSSDTDVATVTGGIVTGVAPGTAVITARVEETHAAASATVTVTES